MTIDINQMRAAIEHMNSFGVVVTPRDPTPQTEAYAKSLELVINSLRTLERESIHRKYSRYIVTPMDEP